MGCDCFFFPNQPVRILQQGPPVQKPQSRSSTSHTRRQIPAWLPVDHFQKMTTAPDWHPLAVCSNNRLLNHLLSTESSTEQKLPTKIKENSKHTSPSSASCQHPVDRRYCNVVSIEDSSNRNGELPERIALGGDTLRTRPGLLQGAIVRCTIRYSARNSN